MSKERRTDLMYLIARLICFLALMLAAYHFGGYGTGNGCLCIAAGMWVVYTS